MSLSRRVYPDPSAFIDVTGVEQFAYVDFHGNSKTLLFIQDVVASSQSDAECNSRKRRSVKKANLQKDVKRLSVERLDNDYSENLSSTDYDIEITKEKVDDDSISKNECKALFGFRTPKRSRLSTKSGDTKKTVEPDESVEENENRSRKTEATTPYRLASRFVHSEDLSDSSVESSDEDNENESIDDNEANLSKKSSRKIPNMAEDFFKAQSEKGITSDHTMARLREDGSLDRHSLRKYITTRTNGCRNSVLQLMSEYKSLFNIWMLQLCLGFNLILYGYGSKKNLIEEFRRTLCKDFHCVVVNGFFPSLTLKEILSSITEDCLGMDAVSSEIEAIATAILDELQSRGEELFLFIHNIEGLMLRSSLTQETLAKLTSTSNVHIVASADHINTPLMWNQSTVTKFKWIWYDATTYEPYIQETSYEDSFMSQQSGNLALKSIINVFKSLTPNAKNIFILMTKYHIDHFEEPSYIGIPFQVLYRKCREGFLVNSDQTLRTQLVEFRDHKLVLSKKGADGAENLYLPADLNALKDFLEQVE